MNEDAAIVLAAGQGTRMRSNRPKVLHALAGKPMLARVLDALSGARFPQPLVLVGAGSDQIRRQIGDRCHYLDQGQQLGTGHAARVCLDALPSSVRRVLMVHGDEPLVPAAVYRDMLDAQSRTHSSIVLLTTQVKDTRGFGRVVRNQQGGPVALVQESDLTPEQRSLDEVNLGAYVFTVDLLRRHLPRLQPHPPKGEYYLTDVVAMAVTAGAPVHAVTIEGGTDVMGINDLMQLEQAHRAVYRRKNLDLMAQGVTIVDSASTFIDEDADIGVDTIIQPLTIIQGSTRIGRDCTIGPSSHIVSSEIGERCRVLSSTLEGAVVCDDVTIGPYAHLRPGAEIGAAAEIGNYAEIKQAKVGARTRMHHFGYMGDAEVGADVNIGAGTVSCNFDGTEKHRTVIEDDVFLGSDTMLRAPLTIGKGARTGAGSVVTRDVAPGTTVAGVPARELVERSSDEAEVG